MQRFLNADELDETRKCRGVRSWLPKHSYFNTPQLYCILLMYNSERHQSCPGIARRAGYAHHSKHTACRRNQERLLTGEGAPTNPLSLKQSKMAVESGSEWRLCRMLAQILQNGKRLLTTRLELATSRLLNGCSTNRAPPAADDKVQFIFIIYASC